MNLVNLAFWSSVYCNAAKSSVGRVSFFGRAAGKVLRGVGAGLGGLLCARAALVPHIEKESSCNCYSFRNRFLLMRIPFLIEIVIFHSIISLLGWWNVACDAPNTRRTFEQGSGEALFLRKVVHQGSLRVVARVRWSDASTVAEWPGEEVTQGRRLE